jgi:Ca-activated chloride channel family protein
MIHFEWLWLLLCLPLPWLVQRLLPAVTPPSRALFLPFATTVGAEQASLTHRPPRWLNILLLVIWLLIIAAAIRPQWLGDAVATPTSGRRLMLAVDTSGSMQTPDMAGDATRLQVVQHVASQFIKARHGDQVGLILFGTQPYLQAPLTMDLNTVDTFLQEAVIGMAGPETGIGDAIGLAIKRIKNDNDTLKTDPQNSAEAKGKMVLILLTDGSNNAGMMPPLEAAKLAAANGLRIYTIGVGAAAEEGFFGSAGNTDLDEDTLKAIAKTTGGEYFRASDARALQQVYGRIDELEPTAGRAQWYRPRTELFHWPLGIALLLSIPALLLLRGRV